MASPAPVGATQMCVRRLGRPVLQSRDFSTSSSRRRKVLRTHADLVAGPLSVFPKTSSAELNELLDNLKTTVFVPRHLNADQRRLVYRKNWQHYLTGEEPVRVRLPATETGTRLMEHGDVHTLQPLDRKQEPRHAVSFNRAIDLLAALPANERAAAWARILPQLLRELHTAGRQLGVNRTQRLVRRAAASDGLGAVLESLSRVASNGFRLRHVDVARYLLWAAHARAARSNFGLGHDESATDPTARAELDRAVNSCKTVVLMGEDARHVEVGVRGDTRRAPELYGAAMALLALRRHLYLTQNTPEKIAARAELATAKVPDVQLPEGAETAVETPSGKTPAEAAADAAAAEETSAAEEQAEKEEEMLFAKGATDGPALVEHARRMLDLAEHAELSWDMTRRGQVVDMLKAWLPAWFGTQLAARVLEAELDADSRALADRLRAAWQADIGPQVARALEALSSLSAAKAKASANVAVAGVDADGEISSDAVAAAADAAYPYINSASEVQQMYEQYRRFLA